MARDPHRTAVFRFEQISPLLNPMLTRRERHLLAEAAARTVVVWPSGRHAPVPASTLYRWLARYRAQPSLQALMPRSRPASPKACVIRRPWLRYALALLEEEPERSLWIVQCRLKQRFRLAQPPSRSSLHRALGREGRYRALRRRARKGRKMRTRFEAEKPHQLWQADAKGKFLVRFADRSTAEVTILSLLDDATRTVLYGIVALEEDTPAVVALFRGGAGRWGLPEFFYADRGAAYDAYVIRKGFALLGVRRIPTRSRNAPAHGKIEAYHRVLKRWFVKELRHQIVRDLAHLQQLFDAWVEQTYHTHAHRDVGRPRGEVLGGRRSPRLVSLERLREAFLEERVLKPHLRDGTVRIAARLWRVPGWGPGSARSVRIAIDPEDPLAVFLVVAPGKLVPLVAAVRPATKAPPNRPADAAAGPLTPLVERYRGRILPLAQAGFGLPEIYETLARVLGRPLPGTESEAACVVDWLERYGPFASGAFHLALDRVAKRLGPGRPLQALLRALAREIRPAIEEKKP